MKVQGRLGTAEQAMELVDCILRWFNIHAVKKRGSLVVIREASAHSRRQVKATRGHLKRFGFCRIRIGIGIGSERTPYAIASCRMQIYQ